MNAKAKGTRNEHRSMRLLEAAGYRCTRSAASLGEWDIVGIGSRDVVLVQVKTRDWPGSVEMETLREFTAPPMARKLVHRWRDCRMCGNCSGPSLRRGAHLAATELRDRAARTGIQPGNRPPKRLPMNFSRKLRPGW